MGQAPAAPRDCTEPVNTAAYFGATRVVPEGGRMVVYEFCISLVFITLRRHSSIIHLRPGEHGIVKGLPYCLLSLLFGWWGLPWGVIYTPLTIFTNLRGGFDVTSRFRDDSLKAV
jgi:hypothetical protein